MAASTRTTSTVSQLRNLISQHAVTTSSPPAPPARDAMPPAARPVAAPVVATTAPRPSSITTRYSMRLMPAEVEKVNAVILEAMPRLGERVNFTDVLRIGLSRITPTSPIAAAELAALRPMDGRRHSMKP